MSLFINPQQLCSFFWVFIEEGDRKDKVTTGIDLDGRDFSNTIQGLYNFVNG
jgi:hypothetical protein